MLPTRTLPPGYRSIGTLDIRRDLRLLLGLNLLGAVLLVGAGWLFLRALFWLRPLDASAALRLEITSLGAALLASGILLVILALMLVLHEAIHGLFFRLFTGDRPVFAFHWAYAYAAAPDWFIPRRQYAVIGLAPLVFITLGGLAAMLIVPAWLLLPLYILLTFNAGGAVGDLWMIGWLLRQPTTCLANDRGDALTLYLPV